MTDESASFSTARVRLEEIVTQVRKKDTSLEKSLDLLEEGVRLANACTELIDRADWTVGGVGETAPTVESGAEAAEVAEVDAAGAVEASEGEGAEAVDDQSATASPEPEEIVDGAPEDDAFGDAADEAWANDTPEYRDDES